MREKGTVSFSANFEVQKAAPLDSRAKVNTYAELLLPSTWLANDSNSYAYKGMPVTVSEDPDSSKNGMYILINFPLNLDASWLKIGSGGGSVDLSNYVKKTGESLPDATELSNEYKKVVLTSSGDLKLVNSSEESITIDNAATYDDAIIYSIIGTVVTYSDILSIDPQFQIPQLYQIAVPLSIAGINPEESPYDVETSTGNWQFIGQKLEVTNDNTSKIYISGANPATQLKNITGYKHGDNAIFSDFNTIMWFNQNAVIGANYNPATDTYVSVVKPYDWEDISKGGWVEQSSTDRQRKFYIDAADIRYNARNYPVDGDVIDLNTNNILRLTTTGAPFVDDGVDTIIPDYTLFGIQCAFVKVGELGGGGHVIRNSVAALPQRDNLKFIGNVILTDESVNNTTTIDIPIDLVPTNGSSAAVTSNGVFDALADKVDKNTSIIGATKTKLTYDSKGLITSGSDATTADISDITDKRYQTDNQKTFNDATSSIQNQLNSKAAIKNIIPSNNWDGTAYIIPLESEAVLNKTINNNVTSLVFSLSFPIDASTISRNISVIINNSSNSLAISTISFIGGTWNWDVGVMPVGLASGAIATLELYNENATSVKPNWTVKA